ncbi:MAG: hypothetical protein COB17_02135 [Sulfurimonas sp.]|nr:MAG: hypothetical protein COB17_02135 [Sulfurimonas sp.]
MKNIILALLVSFIFIGCNSNKALSASVEPKLVVSKSLADLRLNDQNEKSHTLSADTKTVVFAFSKDVGHKCNDFFATKKPSYLSDNKTVFVADISSAPSIIRSLFIKPGLKDFKHTVLIIEDEAIASSYKSGMDKEKIIVVSLKNHTITAVKAIDLVQDLASIIEAK